ncbi:ABC transporter permease [Brochothrix campestris]|uniref:ABC-type multidrug transport system, permease component n=1 Tax=Brochothrix campestris FSL F6-1037 TaxID=1265861 RepID=W7CRD7_9LIST|nr:ABC transporter permease [Brochothrix campestris]EUJ42204.1 ABC-type multidrug transport system, permease component [Brochothrix campestris FSL F6-1037]
MTAILHRNLLLYFKNRTNVFFSLLGALIVFVLYVLFLRKNMLTTVVSIPNGAELLDRWLLGAILTVTALTTSFSALGQLIKDKTSHKLVDFSITDLRSYQLLSGYFLSAMVIATLMQVAVFVVCYGYFYLVNGMTIAGSEIGKLCGLMVLTALCASAISLVICLLIQTEATLRTVGSILGALAGFITGAYIPIGNVSGVAEWAIKANPLSYASSLFRHVLMDAKLAKLPSDEAVYLKTYLGVAYEWQGQLTTPMVELAVLIGVCVVFTGLVLLLSKKMTINLKT